MYATQIITEHVVAAIAQEGWGDVLSKYEDVSFTKNPKFGDLQSNRRF